MNETTSLTYTQDGARRRVVSMRAVVLVIAALLCAVVLWLATVSVLNEIDRRHVERRVQRELNTAIPVGTLGWQAEATLKAIRPQVERKTNASFGDRQRLDYLYLIWCDGGRYGHWMETAVVLGRDGCVTEVLVRADSDDMGR